VIQTREQSEPPVAAPASAGTSRLGRWARRRGRQLLWVGSVLTATIIVIVAGAMLSRASRLISNWLAHDQNASSKRQSPSVLASFTLDSRSVSIPFFTAGPEAPENARRMPPEELARWLVTARDAKWLLSDWPWWSIRTSEKRAHAGLVMLLAEELYRRDHGRKPPNDEALVGPYLEHLPDDGTDDLADGAARRVRPSTGLELDPADDRQ
jgi:hypothetical protein